MICSGDNSLEQRSGNFFVYYPKIYLQIYTVELKIYMIIFFHYTEYRVIYLMFPNTWSRDLGMWTRKKNRIEK